MATHSFLGTYEPDDIISWHDGTPIRCHTFLAHVADCAEQLPDQQHVLNLCTDRYRFLIGFAAALIRGQITLLPPSRAPKVMEQVGCSYPGSYYLTDSDDTVHGLKGLSLRQLKVDCGASIDNPRIPGSQTAVIAFTSGSTGAPRPNPKTWESLVSVAQKTGERIEVKESEHLTIVATVPHQHMYGLETSIMLPLQRGWRIHSGRPFFPEDLVSVLHEQSSPRILVSTPIHLRACVMAQPRFPEVAYTLSATAPLPKQLAKQVESLLHTTMIEIYGFAEAGTIATRQPVQENSWTLLSELALVSHNDGYAVSTPYFSDPVPIPDTIQTATSQQFTLEGRPSHLINIGGYRASLDELNVQLLSIEGVVDGVFYLPEEREESVTRLAAFVVAPGKTSESILTTLRNKISPVFLPRPIYLVKALPRTHTGKLLKEDLETFIRTQPSQKDSTGKSVDDH